MHLLVSHNGLQYYSMPRLMSLESQFGESQFGESQFGGTCYPAKTLNSKRTSVITFLVTLQYFNNSKIPKFRTLTYFLFPSFF